MEGHGGGARGPPPCGVVSLAPVTGGSGHGAQGHPTIGWMQRDPPPEEGRSRGTPGRWRSGRADLAFFQIYCLACTTP